MGCSILVTDIFVIAAFINKFAPQLGNGSAHAQDVNKYLFHEQDREEIVVGSANLDHRLLEADSISQEHVTRRVRLAHDRDIA